MIRTVAIAVLLAGTTFPFGGRAHRRTEEGNRLYVDKAYADALRAYTEAQVAAPDAPELYYDIGNVLYRQGDFAGAEEAYRRALRAAPDDLRPDAAFNLGNALYRQKSYNDAVEAYRRALERSPHDADAKRNLELALRALEQQTQKNPEPKPDKGGGEREPGSSKPQGGKAGGEKGAKPQEPHERNPGGSAEAPHPDTTRPEMSRDDAERLLDRIAEAEREQREQQAARRVVRSSDRREKDW